MTDFLQQLSGDVAFAEVKPEGTARRGRRRGGGDRDDQGQREVPSPVGGTVVEVNPAMELSPEVINQDPYGEGWLAVIEAADWPTDRDALLDPQAYFELMKGQAEEEAKKL